MKLALLLLLLLVHPDGFARADEAPASAERTFQVVGYLPWYRVKSFSAERIGPVTDLIYFSVEPSAAGRLKSPPVEDAVLDLLHEIRDATGCRLHLCVGGGGRSKGFPALTADPSRRTAFVRSLCRFCREEEFAGVDYDWEYPRGESQLADFAALLVETKRALGEDGVVSVAQSPWRDFGTDVYETVDRVHVMSYNHRFPQARLEDSRKDVLRMLSFGCPEEKLVLGVPFYGRNARGRTKTYADLSNGEDADLIDGYALNGRKTVRTKTRYAVQSRLAGVMIWELGQDSADPEASLLSAIEEELQAPREKPRVRIRR